MFIVHKIRCIVYIYVVFVDGIRYVHSLFGIRNIITDETRLSRNLQWPSIMINRVWGQWMVSTTFTVCKNVESCQTIYHWWLSKLNIKTVTFPVKSVDHCCVSMLHLGRFLCCHKCACCLPRWHKRRSQSVWKEWVFVEMFISYKRV